MAILVIWSSPNTDGLTAAAKDKVVEGLTAAGKEVEVVHLNRKKIEQCRACGNGWGTCRQGGSCVLKDDFAELYEAMQRCDAFVLVTPVYWGDASENLKALLDRVRRCDALTNRSLEGKRCMLVACAGGTGRGAASCLRKLEETMDHMGIVPLERLPVIRFNREYILPALESAGKMFARHYADWKLR